MGDGHGGIDKVASSWTLHGWSPPWTRAIVTLRGLKSPSTWMYDSTTYRNHAKNLRVSNCICTLKSHPFTFLQSCMLYFPLLIYSCHACLICIVNVKTCAKTPLQIKEINNCNFSYLESIHPPSRHLFSILSNSISITVMRVAHGQQMCNQICAVPLG